MSERWRRWTTGGASVLATVLLAAILGSVALRDGPQPERPDPQPAAQEHDAAPAAPIELAKVHLPPPPAPPPPAPASRPVAEPAPPPPPARREPPVQPPSRPKPAAQEPPPPTPATVSPEAAAEGRARLRMLEHGEGPTIEIAWPETRQERDRLHDLFTRCYGMRVLLLDGGNRLFGRVGAPGDPWPFDADRFSGFVRAPSGATAAAERATADAIRRRHGIYGARLVRIFPRRVDAMLLGGLGQVIGSGYADTATIRAAYRVSGGDVVIGDIRVDGRTIPGDIRLVRRTCASR